MVRSLTSETSFAAPAVSPATTGFQPFLRMYLRHWPSAWMWLWTVLISSRFDARQHHQLEMDRQEIFADDVQLRFRQQMMDVGDAAGDGVLDRDHGEVGLAGLDRVEGILEGRARQRLHRREHVAAGGVGIGARLALEGYSVGLFRPCPTSQFERISLARSRSSGVSTPSGSDCTISASMRMPASSARNCSSRSRRSSGDGFSATKRSSAARR